MKRFLIVVDMQNDFVDGALGSPDAVGIVSNAVEKIRSFRGEIIATLDTHFANYLETAEGKKLPVVHCIEGTEGWKLNPQIEAALKERSAHYINKPTFGSTALPHLISSLSLNEEFSIELIGLCTDICVVSNALLLKAHFPDAGICVDASCCAGVTKELHEAALLTMKSCQIDVKNFR